MVGQVNPQNYSVDAGDLIPHWRVDGIRPIVFTDDLDNSDHTVYRNWLSYQASKLHVDYVICSAFQELFIRTTQIMDIPVLSYEGDGKHGDVIRLANQFLAAKPTAAYMFYSDPLTRDLHRLSLYLEKNGISTKWLAW